MGMKRLQSAGLLALLGVLLLAALVPTRTVRVLVDGNVTNVESRSSSDVAVVRQAGVELEPGDSVEAIEDGLAVRRATEAVLRVDGKAYAIRTRPKRSSRRSSKRASVWVRRTASSETKASCQRLRPWRPQPRSRCCSAARAM